MLERIRRGTFGLLVAMGALAGCAAYPDAPLSLNKSRTMDVTYRIGAGDQLQVFVWRNTELSATMRVRPDGYISSPLIEDLPIAGKTPTEAARAIEEKLSNFVKDPVVTVIMVDFIGPVERQIRVIGEAAKPQSLPYRVGVSAMDVLIQAGGLTQFADGNRAIIVRLVDGKPVTYRLRLDDLMKNGDLSANAEMAPGDVLMIPQSWF
ncbi:MAG: polysaccharide biosynthesis/export family protein [Alphaproteobacteria bacterium]|nr:polysaccharide biosynthesis/export family protein [Alphaproteobacteria bacterium]